MARKYLFDESKHKRDASGKFAPKAGGGVRPGSGGTSMGSRINLQPVRPKKGGSGKGKKGAKARKGCPKGLVKSGERCVTPAQRDRERALIAEAKRRQREREKRLREARRAFERAARERARKREQDERERSAKRQRSREDMEALAEAVRVAKSEGRRSAALRSIGGNLDEMVKNLRDAGIAVTVEDGVPVASYAGMKVRLLRGKSRHAGRVAAVDPAKLTVESREKAADDGAALPDGKLPTRNRDELASAVKLRNHVKGHTPGEVRRYLVRRARALNATDLLPEEWKR